MCDFPFHIVLTLSYRTLSESIEPFLKPGALSPWPAALLSHAVGQRRPQLRRASGPSGPGSGGGLEKPQPEARGRGSSALKF